MIGSFQYLRFDIDTGYYREHQTSLFNKKEIELIKKVDIVSNIKSGDVVHKSVDFYSKIMMYQRDLKDYYTNLLSNSGTVLSNALSPEKCTLFIEDTGKIQVFEELKKDVADIDDTKYSYFRKIPYESFRKRVVEETNFSFVVNNFDYGKSFPSTFEPVYVTNDYFYILMEDEIKDTVFENETVLKGFSVNLDNSYLPLMLHTLMKSAYSPKIISTNDFVKSVRNLKTSISYEEFIQMQSYIGTDYEGTLTRLLQKYDETYIINNLVSQPESYIYWRILKKNVTHHDIEVRQALTEAYSTGKEHLIQTYLSYINSTMAYNLDDIVVAPGTIEFKPVCYYTWSGPSVYSNLDFTKDVENLDEVE